MKPRRGAGKPTPPNSTQTQRPGLPPPKGTPTVYVPLSQVDCKQAPLPADSGAIFEREAAALTQSIRAAQNAFTLATQRPDLAPNGFPWGSVNPAGVPGGTPSAGDSTSPLAAPNWYDAPAYAVGAVDALGKPIPSPQSNPRVVEFPHCSPITTAQRRADLVVAQGCDDGTVNGNFISTYNSAMYPTEVQPGVNNPQGGGGTPQPLSDCGNPMQCAGNTPYYAGVSNSMPLGANAASPYPSMSPAMRARRGGLESIPWWAWAVGVYALSRITR
jgi:hypothetical protein